MALSVFDLFKSGIGPSSSHTVGPMLAAHRFADGLSHFEGIARIRTDLYGSLALTGRGHCTDKAVLLGLSGEKPDSVDPDMVDPIVEQIRTRRELRLMLCHTWILGSRSWFHRLFLEGKPRANHKILV